MCSFVAASGSTGQPKGVELSHQSVMQSLLAHDYEIPQFKRFLQFAAPTFDVSMFEIFFTFFRGGTLVCCDRTELLNDLPGMMRNLQIDAAELTPTVVGSLLRIRETVPDLKLLLTIGEMLTEAVIKQFGDAPGRKGILYGMYGPTEAAIHCTIQPEFKADMRPGIIGTPLKTASCFILRPASSEESNSVEVLPIGNIGELVIGGHQLASGYLNRPEQTRASFVHSSEFGRLYRTGDKARILPTGIIECLGRIESGQVKLRGQRVELGEIENAAAKSRGVQFAIAIVLGGILVVFCLIENDDVSADHVKQTCKIWLPSFMVPNDVVLLKKLPRLPSGKADHKRLQTMYEENASRTENHVLKPQNDLEYTVCSITSTLLGQEVQMESTVAKLAIDSLMAIRLASRLRQAQLPANAIDMLNVDTIKELCDRLANATSIEKSAPKPRPSFAVLEKAILHNPAIKQYGWKIDDVFPCTPIQTSMIAETMRNPQAYCNWVEMEFADTISSADVVSAFRYLIASNEVLRSGFSFTDDGTAQIVWSEVVSDQIRIVEHFDYSFSIKDTQALLRPFRIDVTDVRGRYHALIFIHHALYDGWSIDLLLADLNNLLKGDQPAPRPQFRRIVEYYQTSSFALAQNMARDYWKGQLLDCQRIAFPNLTGFDLATQPLETAELHIPIRVSEILSCFEDRTHPQVLFQSALSYLLSVYLGASEVVFGTVTSGRLLPVTGIESVIGPCIATLPLHVDVKRANTFRDLLNAVSQGNRQLQEYSTITLQEIRRICRLDPGQSLFDVLFIWQETLDSLPRSTARARILKSADFLEFALVCEVEPCEDGVELLLRYQPALIPAIQAESLLSQLAVTVGKFVEEQTEYLEEINGLLPSNLLSIANPEPVPTAITATLANFVEQHATTEANNIALIVAAYNDDQVLETDTRSYAALNSEANRLAHLLQAKGVKRNDLVCVFMEKSIDLYTSILAVIKSGAGYLPITPETPEERVRYIVQEAGVALCLMRSTSPSFATQFENVESLIVDEIDCTKFPDNNLNMPLVPSDAAYCVFTSGTTGKPKGVLVTQENLVGNIEVLSKLYPCTQDSRLLQACSQAFDVSVFEIFFTWYSGMCLCAAKNDVLFRDLEDAIRFFGITHLSLTPTVAALVNPDNVPKVEFLVTSGEGVTDLVFRKWAGKGLFNGYGPSETTNICSVNPRTRPQHARNNVGPPLQNTSAFVIQLDSDEFRLLPQGGLGELCFGGEQVFRGYLNQAKLTASKLFDHPRYGRVYRSGDLGRILSDGSIVVLGRVDDQVKIRGQRIELGELSNVLMQSKDLQDCAILVTDGQQTQARHLIAFIVPREQRNPSTTILDVEESVQALLQQLFRSLAATLPAYMMPSVIVPVGRLPMTAQGKIDKRRLLELYGKMQSEQLSSVSRGQEMDEDPKDWTNKEREIAAVVSASAGVAPESLRRNTSFFSLGIDSVSAIPLARRLRSKLDPRVEVSWILRFPSVAGLAGEISQLPNAIKSVATAASDLSNAFHTSTKSRIMTAFNHNDLTIQYIRPCTPLQEAMLSAEASKSNSTNAYSNHTIFNIDRRNVSRFEHCFRIMCQRHEILRTCFISTSEIKYSFAQVVIEKYIPKWESIETSDDDLDHDTQQLPKIPCTAIDTMVPPLRLQVIQSPTNARLAVSMHHALYDGEAIALLFCEVEQIFRGEELPTPVSFQPFLAHLIGYNVTRGDAYWDRHLKGFISLPFPRIALVDSAGSEKTFSTTRDLEPSLSQLDECSRKSSSTMLSLCQAAWAKVLYHMTSELDICFGNVVSGRTVALEGLDRLIAPCFNTLPVRLNLKTGTTNVDVVHRLQQLNAESLDHQFTPLRRIQARWGRGRDRLFETLFILQRPSRILDHAIWSLQEDIGDMGFPLVCEVVPCQSIDKIYVTLHYERSVMSQHQAAVVIDTFEGALRHLYHAPSDTFDRFTAPALIKSVEDSLLNDHDLDMNDLSSHIQDSIIKLDRAIVIRSSKLQIGTKDSILVLVLKGYDSRKRKKSIVDAARAIMASKLPPKTMLSLKVVVLDNPAQNVNRRPSLLEIKRLYLQEKSRELTTAGRQSDSHLSSLELSLRNTFTDFCGMPADKISRSKNIFQLGLDSINAIQLARVLREAGHKISGQDVLDYPTIADLASYIEMTMNRPSQDHSGFDFISFENSYKYALCEQLSVPLCDLEAVRPCTSLQAGMIAQFVHSGGSVYFNKVCVELEPTLMTVDILEAWRRVMGKHVILRTGFAAVDDPHHAFAMLMYRADVIQFPCTKLEDGAHPHYELHKLHLKFAQDIVKQMHLPPWRLALMKSNNNTYLQLSIHHALYDVECLSSIFHDIAQLHNTSSVEQPSSFDLALGEVLAATEDQDKSHCSFWTKMMQGATPTKFPNLTPLYVSERTVCSRTFTSTVSKKDIIARCKMLGITSQTVFMSAWVNVLAAYTGEPDVIFGLVLSGRNISGADGVVFPTAVTVPFRCSANADAETLLRNVMSLNTSIRSHQHSPLTHIQRWSGRPKEALFDTIFVYQERDDKAVAAKLWKVIDETATVEYPVSFEVNVLDDQYFEMQLVFWEDVLPSEQADLLLKQINDGLLELIEVNGRPHCSSSSVATELLSVLPPKNPSIATSITTLHGFFEASARDYGDRIALEFVRSLESPVVKVQYTYKELNQVSNQVAHAIMNGGVQAGSVIGICFDKCAEASFATLGILKSGCAFVAVDHTAPEARKRFVLEDSRAVLVLTMRSSEAAFENHVPMLFIDELRLERLPRSAPEIAIQARSDDACYCLYTSGSTGTPKGCVLTHENVVQFILAFQNIFRGHWSEDSRFLQFASFHFDVSVMEQFFSWSVGICVVSVPRDVIFEDLIGSLRTLAITHIDLTPSLARLVTPEDVPSLCRGVFITGGEPLKQEILNTWGSKAVIYNGYGPTECTIGCTMYPRVPQNGKPSNIGWLYDNAGCYIFLPGTTTPVLRGAPGELCISGKLVGRGYLNRPELNEERFPYLDEFGGRVYRTGDLVRLLHNNTFDFLGRIDDQVKLRGQRLELGEINAAIRESSSAVTDVATLVVKHPTKQTEQLVAFITLKGTVQGSENNFTGLVPQDHAEIVTIQQACRSRLAAYMVPSLFVPVREVPLTPNNKVDAKALKSIFSASLDRHDDNQVNGEVSGRGTLSKHQYKIAQILAKSLAVSVCETSASSNIFQLGLDSISVFGFARALRRAGLGLAQPGLIMSSKTIGDLADKLYGVSDANVGAVLVAKQWISVCQHQHRVAVARALNVDLSRLQLVAPCTPLQQGMIARSLDSTIGLYYNNFIFELTEVVDMTVLQAAWQSVFDTMAILRVCFIPVDEGYVQGVIRRTDLPWRELHQDEFEQSDAELLRKQWHKQNNDTISKPFEIITVNGPSGRRLMILHLFHALYDASSIPLLLDAVAAQYTQTPMAPSTSFFDVLPYGPLLQPTGAKSFWTEQLRYVRFTPFTEEEKTESHGDNEASLEIDVPELEKIRKWLKVTPQALVQVCWLAVLYGHLGSSTTVGLLVSGRSIDHVDAEQVIGPMFNTIPFFEAFSEADTWTSAVQRCHKFNIAALPYQHTPLRDIAKWRERTSSVPLFDTLLVFQKHQRETGSRRPEFWNQQHTPARADYALSFEAEQISDERLRITIVALRHAADPATCIKLLKSFEKTLKDLLSDPGQRLPKELATVPLENGNLKTNGACGPVHTTEMNYAETEWTFEATQIRDTIAEIAGIDASMISQSSSIFELGLDSIDAIKLSSRIKAKGLDLSVSSIMRNPRLEGMLKHILSTTSAKGVAASGQFDTLTQDLNHYFEDSKSKSRDIEAILPATPLQEAMLADMVRTNFVNYFNHDVLRLAPHTDIELLKHACQRVVEASPILRTSFVNVDDPNIGCAYAQIVRGSVPEIWTTRELSAGAEVHDLLEEIRCDVSEHADKSLFRLHFLRGNGDQFLVVSMAHALYDGWSLSLMHADIRRAFNDEFNPRPDYRETLQTIITGSGPSAKMFWANAMHDALSCKFPKRPRQEAQAIRLMHRAHLESRLSSEELRAFTRKHNVTLQALGQTCWAFVLASRVQALDVTFGTVLSGRDTDDAQQVMFPTMNTVAVRSFIHSTRATMLHYMQTNLGETMQYQHYPLRKIQQQAALEGGKLFDTLFIYQRQPALETEVVALYESIGGASTTDYPVNTEMEIVADTLVWRTACEDTVVTEEGAVLLLQQLDEVLERIVRDPNAAAIEVEGENISICGLHAFQMQRKQDQHSASPMGPSKPNAHDKPAAWSSVEAVVRTTLATVAKVPESSVTKNQTLFQLGLDSISAIQVTSLLRKQSHNIGVSELLRAATVAKIAAVIAQSRTDEVEDTRQPAAKTLEQVLSSVDIEAVLSKARFSYDNNVDAIWPASPGQVLFLSLWQNNGGALFYPTFEYEIEGHVDVDVLRKAWQSLVQEYQILRTIFFATATASMPFLQMILKDVPDSFTTTKFESRSSWRIGSGYPPVKLLAEHKNDRLYLKLQIHHALYDAISLPILVRRLQDFCNNQSTLRSRLCSYSDYLALTAATEATHAFWTKYLSGLARSHSHCAPVSAFLPRIALFVPHALPNLTTYTASLRSHGLSLQSLFLAAVASAHAAHRSLASSTDVLVGVYLANRTLSLDGLEQLASPTVNVVPVRVKAPLGTSLLEVARQVQHDVGDIGSARKAGVGLWQVERWSGVKVDCIVNFLKLPEAEVEHGVEAEPGVSIREVQGVIQGRDARDVQTVPEDVGRDLNVVAGAYAVSSCTENRPRSKYADDRVQPTIDFEAAVRDGALDIGIFAPQSLASNQESVDKILEDVKGRLMEVLEV